MNQKSQLTDVTNKCEEVGGGGGSGWGGFHLKVETEPGSHGERKRER